MAKILAVLEEKAAKAREAIEEQKKEKSVAKQIFKTHVQLQMQRDANEKRCEKELGHHFSRPIFSRTSESYHSWGFNKFSVIESYVCRLCGLSLKLLGEIKFMQGNHGQESPEDKYQEHLRLIFADELLWHPYRDHGGLFYGTTGIEGSDTSKSDQAKVYKNFLRSVRRDRFLKSLRGEHGVEE